MQIIPAVFLAIFGGVCLLVMSPAWRDQSYMLQYPFLAGGGMLGFLFVQAVGSVANPGDIPEEAVVKALLMSTLCVAATYVGWNRGSPPRTSWEPNTYSVMRLYWVGIAMLGVGLWGFLKLASLSGGITAFLSSRGAYTLEWRGITVVYSFFANYLTPGLAICAICSLQLRLKWRLLPAAVAFAIQAAAVVFLGRRSPLVMLLLFVLCTLYFTRQWLPPRIVILAGLPLVALAILLAPEYRSHSQIDSETPVSERVHVGDTVEGLGAGSQGEFYSMAYLIQVIDDSRLCEYGVGFYNMFVSVYVPRIIVGDDFKESLFVHFKDDPGHTPNQYGWQISTGMVPTGPGSAYREFWYLGCIWFGLVARFMRRLWDRARAGDVLSQCLYAGLIMPAIASITNDMYALVDSFFLVYLPLTIIAHEFLRRQAAYAAHPPAAEHGV